MKWAVLLSIVAVLGACTAPDTPEPPEDNDQHEPTLLDELAKPQTMTMSGMKLWMHDYSPTAGEARKPTLWVYAEHSEVTDENMVWSLTEAEAVIFGKDDEEITVHADAGHFDEAREIAQLEGGVEVHAGTMELHMADIVWNNAEGLARSDKPLTVLKGATELRASALELDPRKERFLLKEVSGRLYFEGIQR